MVALPMYQKLARRCWVVVYSWSLLTSKRQAIQMIYSLKQRCHTCLLICPEGLSLHDPVVYTLMPVSY